MINFRYHVVSLVAVFVALAIGVTAGTTVIDNQLIKSLRNQRLHDQGQLAQSRASNDTLRAQLSVWNSFGQAQIAPLVRGTLSGRSVILVVVHGTPSGLVTDVAAAVKQAGATTARMDLSDRWQLDDDATRQTLTTIVRAPAGSDDAALTELAAARLAARLRSPGAVQGDDVLRALEQADLIDIAGPDRAAFPPRGSLVVVVWPGRHDTVPDVSFTLALVSALAGAVPTLAAEPIASSDSLTDRITGDAALASAVATVDHVDTMPGRYAMVIALWDRLRKQVDHFGTRRRTDGVAPTPSPSP